MCLAIFWSAKVVKSHLFFLWWFLIKMYPSQGIVLEIKERRTGALTAKHWAAIAIFLLTALGWFFGTSLKLSTGTVALLPVFGLTCSIPRTLGNFPATFFT
jgi:di/tricarboxylate transporter